ncbi:MAG TPA: CpsB/CapC family capsule biosynthesis tyrosine phosphatase [Sphaerochaeta sp.]|nr:CpsB/CapC family capsule biosynthesis tyrosine phosphatase [Sphaerochaeta sp.]
MGIRDLHCHLLPGIDDGYGAEEDFVRMLRIYRESGVSAIAFTPHLYNPYVTTHVERLRTTYRWAEALALAEGITPYLGGEVFLADGGQQELLPIAGRYQLVEFSLSLPPANLIPWVRKVVAEGIVPIIAHVERYLWLGVHSPLLRQLIDFGCLLQCNVEAVESGEAEAFLTAGLVDVIATDNHGDESLAPRLAQAIAAWPDVAEKMQRLIL